MFHTIISEKDNIINSNILIFDFSLCTRVLTSRNYRILDKAIAFFDFQIYIFSKPCAIINHRGPRGQINNVANSQRNEAVFHIVCLLLCQTENDVIFVQHNFVAVKVQAPWFNFRSFVSIIRFL